MTAATYGFSVSTALSTDAAEARVTELLKEEGFGVLTRIDIRGALREKLDVEFRPYRILGACNPRLAHRALLAEPAIGLLLPCNVTVEEAAEGGSLVSFLDPLKAMGMVGNDDLQEIASEADARLRRVAAKLND